MLKDEDILDQIQTSFAPLQCKVQIWDYEAKIRLAVFDARGRRIASFPSVPLWKIRNERLCEELIQEVRGRIEGSGIVLK